MSGGWGPACKGMQHPYRMTGAVTPILRVRGGSAPIACEGLQRNAGSISHVMYYRGLVVGKG